MRKGCFHGCRFLSRHCDECTFRVGFCRSLPFGLIRCTVQLCCGAIDKNRPGAVIRGRSVHAWQKVHSCHSTGRFERLVMPHSRLPTNLPSHPAAASGHDQHRLWRETVTIQTEPRPAARHSSAGNARFPRWRATRIRSSSGHADRPRCGQNCLSMSTWFCCTQDCSVLPCFNQISARDGSLMPISSKRAVPVLRCSCASRERSVC